MKTGLASVTFRKLRPGEIIRLVSMAGLDGIEWGGDIHVPHGDIKTAREVAEMTKDAGLAVASYGSYYRAGCYQDAGEAFKGVLETAYTLQAPVIRVWAGNMGSHDCSPDGWAKVIEDSSRIASLAKGSGIRIAYEFHEGTLTDSPEAACKLLKSVNSGNIATYWQPPHNQSVQQRLEGLKAVQTRLAYIHVFHWIPGKRLPLASGQNDWVSYLKAADDGLDTRYALLEFVKDDNSDQFLQDACILKEIVRKATNEIS